MINMAAPPWLRNPAGSWSSPAGSTARTAVSES